MFISICNFSPQDVHGCSLSTLRFPVYGLLTTLLLYESGPQVLGRGCLRRRWLSWFDFVWKPIATISFPRSRVPEEGEETRRRENERARKRENELVFSFSRNNNSYQKLHKNAATRIRTIESATHANPCFRFRVPAPLFVSFPRPSLFRFGALLCYVFSC